MSEAGAPEQQQGPLEIQPHGHSHEEDEGDCHERGDQVICVKCDEKVPMSKTLSAGRPGCRVCKLCYNSCRSLAEHFRKRGKKEEWDKMPAAKKKKLIKENKNGGGIRGKERTIRITEEATRGNKKNIKFDMTSVLPNKRYQTVPNMLFYVGNHKGTNALYNLQLSIRFFPCKQVEVRDRLSMEGQTYHTNEIEHLP